MFGGLRGPSNLCAEADMGPIVPAEEGGMLRLPDLTCRNSDMMVGNLGANKTALQSELAEEGR